MAMWDSRNSLTQSIVAIDRIPRKENGMLLLSGAATRLCMRHWLDVNEEKNWGRSGLRRHIK